MSSRWICTRCLRGYSGDDCPRCDPPLGAEGEPVRDVYMVHCNAAGSVFVKELEFYRSQGGFKERWGDAWRPVIATSVEDAREKGCKLFPEARPYEQQAKGP